MSMPPSISATSTADYWAIPSGRKDITVYLYESITPTKYEYIIAGLQVYLRY